MKIRLCIAGVLAGLLHSASAQDGLALLKEQNDVLLGEIQAVHGYSEAQMGVVREIFGRARYIGQGNPAVTRHPATAEQCRARLEESTVDYSNPDFERICGGKYMSPLYDPAAESIENAGTCIDQFEFPNIPCAYPVVWVRAREAAEICSALGKRLCDAHEWEGGCAGALRNPDYRFDLARGASPNVAVSRMQSAHNAAEKGKEVWSYGPTYRKSVCGTGSQKSPGCQGGEWNACGSNTYPAGYFPACVSPLGVYDLHGNAAEHMNLPLEENQMASRGSSELGHTEMKGSWFIFDTYRAHEDHCRWRAPYWHGGRVMAANSHHNYHLGFRCCKDLPPGEIPE